MDTLTVVEDVEVKEVGGRKAAIVTMLGGSKAGTFEKEVAEAAIAAKGRSVRVRLGQQSGKTILEEIEIVLDEAVPGDPNPLDEEPASVVDNADQDGEFGVDADGTRPARALQTDADVGTAELIATIYHTVTAIQAEQKLHQEALDVLLERTKPKTRAAKPRTPAKTKPAAAKPKPKTTTRKPRAAAKRS